MASEIDRQGLRGHRVQQKKTCEVITPYIQSEAAPREARSLIWEQSGREHSVEIPARPPPNSIPVSSVSAVIVVRLLPGGQRVNASMSEPEPDLHVSLVCMVLHF